MPSDEKPAPAPEPHPDPLTESFIKRALAMYEGRVSPEMLATLREILTDAAENHPMAKAILAQLRSRPGVDKSGKVAKKDIDPAAGSGSEGA